MHQRLVYIDIVKGLSILLLVGFHICGQIYHSEPMWFRILSYQGVPAFFLASGFGLTNALRSKNSDAPPLLFWARWLSRRIWRIIPLYWLTLIITLAVYASGTPALRITPLKGAAMTDFALHALMLHVFFNASFFSINVAWWFIGAIVYFYLAFPVLYGALGHKKAGGAVFLLVIIAVFALNAVSAKAQILLSFLFFTTGVYLRTVSKNPLDLSFRYVVLVFLAGSAACAALLYPLITPGYIPKAAHIYAYALFSLSFVVSACSLSEMVHLLKAPLFDWLERGLRWFGRRSYAIFLIHWGFIYPVISRFDNKALGIVVYLALITAVSWMLTMLDEKKDVFLKGLRGGGKLLLAEGKPGRD
ncbi:MAG: acyltransferase family protein [Thermodesulfobacteriota bacterium]